jgi:hypothetical protein
VLGRRTRRRRLLPAQDLVEESHLMRTERSSEAA